MKNINMLLRIFFTTIFLLISTNCLAQESLLWNPNLKYRAGLVFGVPTCSVFATSLSEGDKDGNESGRWPGVWCEEQFLTTPDDSAPSYFHDTQVGWTLSDRNVYPGWSIWNLAGGNGVPAEIQYLNHALPMSDACTLREVGLIQESFGNGMHSFKLNPDGSKIAFGQYCLVYGKFDAKETYYSGPPRCNSFGTAYITADFRVRYYDSWGNLLRLDLLGVIIDNHNSFPEGDDPVFWKDDCTGGLCRAILYGSKLSKIGQPNVPYLTDNYQSYIINYKALFQRAYDNGILEAPPRPIGEAIPGGFDIYTSVRGADLDFAVKNVDIVGE